MLSSECDVQARFVWTKTSVLELPSGTVELSSTHTWAIEFRWNLCANGKFSIDSMYRALVHSDVPVDDNKNLANEDTT